MFQNSFPVCTRLIKNFFAITIPDGTLRPSGQSFDSNIRSGFQYPRTFPYDPYLYNSSQTQVPRKTSCSFVLTTKRHSPRESHQGFKGGPVVFLTYDNDFSSSVTLSDELVTLGQHSIIEWRHLFFYI